MPRPTRFILYVVRTSTDPDHCDGSVPWRVDERELFFGPCKKALRRKLRREFLGPDRNSAETSKRERVIIAGVNAGHGHAARKLVFVGELDQVMSFAEASTRLRGTRYERMRGAKLSPLHVEPILDDGEVVGYRRVSEEHAEESEKHPGEFSWWDDFVPRNMRDRVVAEGTSTTLRLKDEVGWWEGFPLDACLTLENRFWAAGQGLELDDEALRLLRAAQPDADHVDASAPFGRDASGSAIGKRGSFVEVKGRLAEDLASWLDGRAPSSPTDGSPTTRRVAPTRKC